MQENHKVFNSWVDFHLKRIRIGEDARGNPFEVPSWQIADRCTQLRRIIPVIKANSQEPEKMEGSDDGTDSPLQGAGYGLYAIFGKPRELPKAVQLQRTLVDAPDVTSQHLRHLRFEQNWKKTHPERGRKAVRWSR